MKILTILFLTLSSLIIPFKNKNASEANIILEQSHIKKVYFASGCFWCVEAIYERTKGVINVTMVTLEVTLNPTYESSNTGRTGHAESVEVTYNADEISFCNFIDIYYATQNPFQFNGQGPDKGSQYRSIIFYSSTEEKNIAWDKKKSLEASSKKKVASEIKII